VAEPLYRKTSRFVTPKVGGSTPVEIALVRPMHAVFIKTIPNAAKVTFEGRFFGYTPTYVKVPAHTPVKIEVARAGFKPVVHSMTSKSVTDQVTLRLTREKRTR
jgi:hypothetical protein